MQKLYCYVDETGQDTKGLFFLVALVITGRERDTLRELLKKIEADSGKRQKKWKKTILRKKQAYIKGILNLRAFQGTIFYTEFSQTTQYLSCIIDAIVKGIIKKAEDNYKATIFIDGLGKHQRRAVGARLRRKGIRVEKVRGLRDESDEFIRLADAIAGFVRDYIEEQDYALALCEEALRRGLIARL